MDVQENAQFRKVQLYRLGRKIMRFNMTIDERAINYVVEIYGLEETFKSSITPGLIAARGYKRGAEDERKILTERVWKYLTSHLIPTTLGTDGLVVLQGGINEDEYRKLMMEE